MEYTEVSKKEWEEIILKSGNACYYHSPSWAKIMEETYGYRTATRLYDINGKEILVPMMEKDIYGFKIFDSMPGGYDTGGLFSESDVTVDDFKLLVDDIVGGRNLSFHLALPPYVNTLKNGRYSTKIKNEWKDEFSFIHLLDLEGKDFEYIWKNDFHKKTRGSIRKAIKSGVEIKDSTSLDDYKTLYDMFTKASQRWGYKSPPVPFELVYNIYKYGSDHVKLRLATKDDKIIAGLICFPYSKMFYLLMSAFLPEYGPFNPLSLLYSESIEEACQEDYKYVNFGPSSNKRLIKVKERLGGEKVEINRYKIYSNLTKILNKVNKFS